MISKIDTILCLDKIDLKDKNDKELLDKHGFRYYLLKKLSANPNIKIFIIDDIQLINGLPYVDNYLLLPEKTLVLTSTSWGNTAVKYLHMSNFRIDQVSFMFDIFEKLMFLYRILRSYRINTPIYNYNKPIPNVKTKQFSKWGYSYTKDNEGIFIEDKEGILIETICYLDYVLYSKYSIKNYVSYNAREWKREENNSLKDINNDNLTELQNLLGKYKVNSVFDDRVISLSKRIGEIFNLCYYGVKMVYNTKLYVTEIFKPEEITKLFEPEKVWNMIKYSFEGEENK